MKKLLTLCLSLSAFSLMADLSVSKIFASKMVLQRDRPVPVWGKAAPGENVTVSFAGQSASATADEDGEWQVELKPLAISKEGRVMTVAGHSRTNVFEDVLVGDVWLCSGQSNMEMSFSWGVYDGDKFKTESADFPLIRHMKITKRTNHAPDPFNVPVELTWDTPSNIFQKVTATGYFFARKLVQELDIPIGLVNASWSGCRIEPFISGDGFRAVPGLKTSAVFLESVNMETEKGRATLRATIDATRKWIDDAEAAYAKNRLPITQPPQIILPYGHTGQYNAMIAPITRFPIKGAIWYQGCSNGNEGDEYIDKTEALVIGWRKAWGYDFPFYWVQLASYQAATQDPAGGNGYARIRDAQRKALRIPNTGMAVAVDVGNPRDIHPKAKLFVGERLARWALAKDYGKNIVCSGPLVKEAVKVAAGLDADQASVRISFDYIGGGLMAGKKNWEDNSPVAEDKEASGKISGFALCGADGKWSWADAVIEGDHLVISSPSVPNPVKVRYAYRGNPLGQCNLYNREGLPASPFEITVTVPEE